MRRLIRIIQWLYSSRTVDEIFEPTINDIRHEYRRAVATGHRRLAYWVVFRGYCSVGAAVVAHGRGTLIGQIVKLLVAIKIWRVIT